MKIITVQLHQQSNSIPRTGSDRKEDPVIPGYVQLRRIWSHWILASRLHGRRHATSRETWRSLVDTATLKKSTPWEEEEDLWSCRWMRLIKWRPNRRHIDRSCLTERSLHDLPSYSKILRVPDFMKHQEIVQKRRDSITNILMNPGLLSFAILVMLSLRLWIGFSFFFVYFL